MIWVPVAGAALFERESEKDAKVRLRRQGEKEVVRALREGRARQYKVAAILE